MPTIRSKAELLAIIAPNGNEEITAADIQDFIVSNLVAEVQTIATTGAVATETDTLFADTGATDCTLPLAADYKDRTLTIANNAGGPFTLTASGSDTIDGGASYDVDDGAIAIISPGQGLGSWFIVVGNVAAEGVVTDTTLEGDGLIGTPLKVADDIIQDILGEIVNRNNCWKKRYLGIHNWFKIR